MEVLFTETCATHRDLSNLKIINHSYLKLTSVFCFFFFFSDPGNCFLPLATVVIADGPTRDS